MILAALKEETRSLHEALDSSPRLQALFSPSLDLAQYMAVLESFRVVVAPLEARLAAFFAQHPVHGLDFEERRKLPLLDRDLDYVRGRKMSGEALAPFDGVGEALGCLYVMEGATLGGQVIARTVRRRLGLSQDRGLAFFESYQNDVAQKWQMFRAVLEQEAEVPCQGEAMVDSAKKTFSLFLSHLNDGRVT